MDLRLHQDQTRALLNPGIFSRRLSGVRSESNRTQYAMEPPPSQEVTRSEAGWSDILHTARYFEGSAQKRLKKAVTVTAIAYRYAYDYDYGL